MRDFFTVPARVLKNRKRSSAGVIFCRSFTGTTARTRVSGETLIRFTIGLPRAPALDCGISYTLSQYMRPSSVKISR